MRACTTNPTTHAQQHTYAAAACISSSLQLCPYAASPSSSLVVSSSEAAEGLYSHRSARQICVVVASTLRQPRSSGTALGASCRRALRLPLLVVYRTRTVQENFHVSPTPPCFGAISVHVPQTWGSTGSIACDRSSIILSVLLSCIDIRHVSFGTGSGAHQLIGFTSGAYINIYELGARAVRAALARRQRHVCSSVAVACLCERSARESQHDFRASISMMTNECMYALDALPSSNA
jgi:hypothetical protein